MKPGLSFVSFLHQERKESEILTPIGSRLRSNDTFLIKMISKFFTSSGVETQLNYHLKTGTVLMVFVSFLNQEKSCMKKQRTANLSNTSPHSYLH